MLLDLLAFFQIPVSFEKPRLLLVRMDSIGDFILWIDTAKEYADIYPEFEITLVANRVWANFAKQFPYWDNVLPVDVDQLGGSALYRFKILHAVRKMNAEIAIQPTYSREFYGGDSIVRLSGAKRRIGSTGNCTNTKPLLKRIADSWYTELLSAGELATMELERNADFLGCLRGKSYAARIAKLPILTVLPDHLKFPYGYFIIFPGASWAGRQWPVESFVEVIFHVYHKYAWKAVVCGSPAEYNLCRSLVDLADGNAVNLAGETSLEMLSEIIRGSRLLVGNETSAIHIAAAVNVPSVCILGGGHFGRFMPYPSGLEGIKPMAAVHTMSCFNCNWKCSQAHDPSGPVPCISSISTEQVFRLIHQAVSPTEVLRACNLTDGNN